MRLLLVGAGRQMLKDHLPATLAHPEIEVVGLVEPDDHRRNSVAATHNLPSYVDVPSALRSADVDGAIVSVPHNEYWPILLHLAHSNVATLKEKPLAVDLPEAKRVLRLYRENNTYLHICVQRRYSNLYANCRELVKRIGRVYSLHAESTLALETMDESSIGWRARREIAGGGATLDLGYHLIDLLTFLFGPPSSVLARLSYNSVPGSYSVEDTMKAMMTFNGGLEADLLVSEVSNIKRERIHFFGDRGVVTVDDRRVRWLDRKRNQLESHEFNTKTHEVMNQIEHFLQCSTDRRMLDMEYNQNLADQLTNMRVIDMIYSSHATGAAQRLDTEQANKRVSADSSRFDVTP